MAGIHPTLASGKNRFALIIRDIFSENFSSGLLIIVSLVIIAFLIGTIFFNSISTIELKEQQIVLSKKILFFIPLSIKKVDVQNIQEISFLTNEDYFENDFEGSIVSKFITGEFFYESKNKVYIKTDNDEIETDICLSDSKYEELKQNIKMA